MRSAVDTARMKEAPNPQGLSNEEAAARLRRDGPNRLALQPSRGLLQIAGGVVVQPMFLLLLATAVVYALVGSIGDAAVLLLSVAAVGGISLVQEYRTERVLASLKELSSPRARVVRSGHVVHVPSQELVTGDRLLVAEGDRLACDALLLQANGLTLDESLLSGESAPVLKAAIAPGQATSEAADDVHRLHAGTLVVRGDGIAVVMATGAATALGRIGGALAGIERRPSRVQAELKRVVARVAVFAALASVAAALLYALRQGSWVEGLLAGLTLAMAIIPEEFAVVWTVMLALGAWRLARLGVLTRQAQAIEALGTTSVLCVDKTGTLTHNRMELVALSTPGHSTRIDPNGIADARFSALLQAAAQASVEDGIEPMDRAVLRLAERSGGACEAPALLLQREGVAPERPWFSNLWRLPGTQGDVLAIKGAPESVMAMCGLSAAQQAQVAAEAQRLAQQGLRVLGVAQVRCAAGEPVDPRSAKPVWIGLLGFLDPVRKGVPQAMSQCHAAGIRVVMITGDAPATAAAIARSAGLADGAAPAALTGRELAAMSDAELDVAAQHTSIYARVSPEQKLRIVRALQHHGHVVAMTGDGVNDGPALRAADIGVAMGQRGTDVAREAAALVLLQDSFAALVDAVRMGRRIFGNLRNAVGYLIAVHVPIVGVSLLPVVLGGPVLLLPLHVVLMELLIDPACSLVFEAEPEPRDSMRRPPRPAHVRLLSAAATRRAVAVGGLAFALTAVTLALGQLAALDAAWMRLAALLSLIGGNLLMLVWYRRGAQLHDLRRANLAFQWLLVGVTAALGLIALLSPVVPQLGLPVHPVLQVLGWLLGAVAAAAAAVLLWRWRATPADETPSLQPIAENTAP